MDGGGVRGRAGRLACRGACAMIFGEAVLFVACFR